MDNNKIRTITLTNHRPVKIKDAEWPIIAQATDDSKDHGPGTGSTPTPDYELDHYSLRVRQHVDGRTIVYGILDANTAWTGTESYRGGVLLEKDTEIPAAIRNVGEECNLPDRVIRDCIANLPAEEL